MPTNKIKAAILGPGNIGTDLLYKIQRRSKYLELALVVNIIDSEGISRAKAQGFNTSIEGISAILRDPDIKIVFDCTTAGAHLVHAQQLKDAGITAIDLTPAAVGPYVVPAVNLSEHLDSPNINLITCGGQATIPLIYAISRVCPVEYAEIVATIASPSAGPGTRASIDEFTTTTAQGICCVGGAQKSKAIILLNPAVPPMIMNNTIYCLVKDPNPEKITASINDMVASVQEYVPHYRLKIPPIFDGCKVTLMAEVEGAGDYLPTYSGNLDIETSAALAVGEAIAKNMLEKLVEVVK